MLRLHGFDNIMPLSSDVAPLRVFDALICIVSGFAFIERVRLLFAAYSFSPEIFAFAEYFRYAKRR